MYGIYIIHDSVLWYKDFNWFLVWIIGVTYSLRHNILTEIYFHILLYPAFYIYENIPLEHQPKENRFSYCCKWELTPAQCPPHSSLLFLVPCSHPPVFGLESCEIHELCVQRVCLFVCRDCHINKVH